MPDDQARRAISPGREGIPIQRHRPALVSLRGVGKVFAGRRRDQAAVTALAPLDFDIAEGEFLTVVGPSGCGKSTLLSLIAGLEPPSGGNLRIAGQPVRGPMERLGMVFQKDLLLAWRTVIDNVLIQAEVRGLDRRTLRGRAEELLRLVGLGGFERFYPHELSGGMRQRVAICRALLHDPSLLLMDEPFAALDAITRDQLALDFQRFWQADQRTVVFITHNIAEAVFLGDRVLVMTARPGRIAEVIDVDIARPRALAMRESPEFTRLSGRIREIFLRHGILRG
ncbi:MAG: ABC transporter ATP-binding protein [Acetobacteraceae bacterium]